jgi:hypothetical protein
VKAIEKVNALTQLQREQALDAARWRIAGKEPQVADFEAHTFNRFPPEVLRVMRRIAYVLLLAAFVPSALRIFVAAFQVSAYAIPAYEAAILVGFMSILLAETGQVAFTLWAATTEGLGLRVALWVGALGCTAFALISNLHVVEPWRHNYLLAWVEAILPPALVLIAAHVLKTQSLHAIEARHSAQTQYAEKHGKWLDDCENAHLSPRWMHYAANSLRDALRAANKRSTAVLRDLTDDDWRILILRELAAEEWYARAEQKAEEVRAEEERIETEQRELVDAQRRLTAAGARHAHSGTGGGQRTGETEGAVRDNGDGTYTGTCPHCGEVFMRDSMKGATNALSAHVGRWCKVRNARPGGTHMASANGARIEVLSNVEE